MIDGETLKYKGETFHPYHFNCKSCSLELNASAREIRGELICSKCYDKLDIPICAACRTPIDQERVINALGKQWHVEVSKTNYLTLIYGLFKYLMCFK